MTKPIHKTVKELGEFGLINRLASLLPVPGIPVVKGIGDDCAVYDMGNHRYGVVTADMLVEDVHFSRTFASAVDIGWRAMACNLSDVASMSAIPRMAVISLGLPGNTPVEWVEDLYRGMQECAGRDACVIVGGDTATSEKILINITVLGDTEQEHISYRAGAKVGHKIIVTGDLGASGAGLWVLMNPSVPVPFETDYIRLRHLRPEPRVQAGLWFGQQSGHGALTDSSDGLARDLLNLSEQSKVGFRIYTDKIPIHHQTRDVCRLSGVEPLMMALNGGEDYELVMTAPGDVAEQWASFLTQQFNVPATVIGDVCGSESGIALIYPDGHEEPLHTVGYQHFSGDNHE